MKFKLIVLNLVIGMLASLTPNLRAADAATALACGVGESANENPKTAGEEAAQKAKVKLGGQEAKLVIVFSSRKQLTPELVAGIATVFDKNLVYGCEGYSPVTPEGNFADQGHNIAKGVAVLALGGKAAFTIASAPVAKTADHKADFKECGKQIGDQLKAAVAAESKGKLLITFGNQHVGDNQPFVDGLVGEVGKNLVIVGAAAGGDGSKEIVKGEVVAATNIAILVSGDFKVGMGLAGGQGDLVAKTEESLGAALKQAAGSPVLGLVFDCGGRRGELVKQQKITAEYEVMKKLAGAMPFFGFYGGGEIGTPALGSNKGVGFSVASAVISVE